MLLLNPNAASASGVVSVHGSLDGPAVRPRRSGASSINIARRPRQDRLRTSRSH
jgi:hypothetical protein